MTAAAKHPTPLAPDDRERFRRDPAVYEALERLYGAYDQLAGALDEHTTAIRVLFDIMHEPDRSAHLEKGWTAAQLEERSKERFLEARQETGRAQVRWAAAVSAAEALLRDRQGVA